MASIGGQFRYLRAFRHLALALMAFSLIAPGTACIIVPLPAGPVQETGIIDDATLQSLVGLSEKDVNSRLGTPDFVGPHGRAYLMVYEGEKHYPVRLGVVVVPTLHTGGGAGTVDAGMTEFLVCYVIELDDNRVVQDYEFKEQDFAGTPKRDSADEYITESIDNCSEAVWKPGQREGVLTKIAYLQMQAEGGDRASAFTLASEFGEPMYLKELAQNGDREAAFKLASDFQDATGLRVLAKQGDKNAAYALASDFQDPSALRILLEARAKQGDRAAALALASELDDFTYLKALAQEGDREAAIKLAELTAETAPLKKIANKGDTRAAYALYELLSDEPQTIAEAWWWLCMAANSSSGKAKAEVGYWHRTSVWEFSGDVRLKSLPDLGISPDNRVAYMWYALAGADGAKEALTQREYVINDMRDAQIHQAVQMARDWKSGDCPSAEHRLGAPGAAYGSKGEGA